MIAILMQPIQFFYAHYYHHKQHTYVSILLNYLEIFIVLQQRI